MRFPTKTKKLALVIAAALIITPSILVFLPVGKANAGTLTNTYVRLNRMKTNTDSTMRVVFKTTAAGGATGLTLDMNGTDTTTARWTDAANSGTVNSTQAITGTAGCDVSATALPGGSLAASGATSIITVTGVTALTANTIYCFDLTTSNSVHTPTTAAEYHPTLTETGGATDSTTVAIRVISQDQIVVTATVPPTFNFQFNNTTTDTFSNLTTAGVSTTGKTITLTTNANSGWIVWAKSLNGTTKGSLQSVAAGNYKITSGSSLGSASHALSSSVEDYGLATTIGTDAVGGGTVTLDAAYDGTSTKLGVLDVTNFRPIATANGTTTGDILNVLERASITGATPAANDYTDTITFIGAGNF